MSNTSVMLTKEQKAIIAEALDVMPEDLGNAANLLI